MRPRRVAAEFAAEQRDELVGQPRFNEAAASRRGIRQRAPSSEQSCSTLQ